jgi:hypothetical protein
LAAGYGGFIGKMYLSLGETEEFYMPSSNFTAQQVAGNNITTGDYNSDALAAWHTFLLNKYPSNTFPQNYGPWVNAGDTPSNVPLYRVGTTYSSRDDLAASANHTKNWQRFLATGLFDFWKLFADAVKQNMGSNGTKVIYYVASISDAMNRVRYSDWLLKKAVDYGDGLYSTHAVNNNNTVTDLLDS